MKRSLRTQLMFSHLTLVALMALVMLGAVVNFFRLGLSIDRILKQNYKSVIAAQTMKEALERQDSAANFFLAGQSVKARIQYEANREHFERAYKVESTNITERGEQQLSDEIGRRYGAYRKSVEGLLNANPPISEREARAFYFRELEPAFVHLKALAQQVLDLNQKAIERADQRAKAEARLASWAGVGMTIGALLLAVVFALRSINSALTPLLALSQGAEEIGAGHLNRRIELNRGDEIGVLADSFNTMAEKLREARRIEQQRLHRAQKMSDAALESLYDPVIVTDASGSVVHLNLAAQELFGSSEKASGLPIAQVVNEPRITAAVEHAIRQERVSAEEGEEAFVPLVVEGAERSYRLRATPMRDDDGALLGAAMVLEDITHLRELSRLKTEFIGVASHELRTPVTSLLLSAELLQEGAAGPLSEPQREIVTAQREDLGRLDQLLRDLLDVSRLETGATSLHLAPVEARDAVDAACRAVVSQAESKGVRLETGVAEGLPQMKADRAQVTRVVVNLLNNAIRHTEKGGLVKVSAQVQSGKLAIQVTDTGSGIPGLFLPRIFDRFVQVPGATRGGAGLGLSIAESIVQAHGGEIGVQSEVGNGTSVTFTIPVA